MLQTPSHFLLAWAKGPRQFRQETIMHAIRTILLVVRTAIAKPIVTSAKKKNAIECQLSAARSVIGRPPGWK